MRGRTDLRRLSADIRRTIIERSWCANVGHIGSCLSIADVLAALYGATLPRMEKTTTIATGSSSPRGTLRSRSTRRCRRRDTSQTYIRE